jgi:hypothetical protein
MSWDEARFSRFVDATLRMARGELPGYGYPHVVFPYAPEDEVACIAAMRLIPARLSQAGFSYLLLSVAQMVARATARYARRELPEAQDYHRLQSDLADLRGGVVAKTTEICAAEIRAHGTADTVVLLCRLGALYPFGHVSALLDALYRAGIRNTIAAGYPGTADGTQLRFLGLLDPTGGYRGHVVT